jgi:sporulation protein YlmC with PRC-barrel domain
MNTATGRRIDAALQLLDRQIVDAEGRFAGKVDDLELEPSADGTAVFVTAILSGPGALAHRLGGRIGKWLERMQQRLLHPGEAPGPARVPFGVVKDVGNHVEVTLPRADLETNRFEVWVRTHMIEPIPGARDATE